MAQRQNKKCYEDHVLDYKGNLFSSSCSELGISLTWDSADQAIYLIQYWLQLSVNTEASQRCKVPLGAFKLIANTRKRQVYLPSMITDTTSLRIENVVHRTRNEKMKVQMGSAILYSGCKDKASSLVT